MNDPRIAVYGADWCSKTRATIIHLRRLKIPYRYINIEQDRLAAEWVSKQNNGKEKKPTLDIDGQILTEPTNSELDQILREKGFLS